MTPSGRRPKAAASVDEERRYRALLELPLAEGAGIDRLMAALADESWRVRKAAVERLVTEIPSGAAVPGLIQALSDEESASRRSAALEALVKLGEAALPALCEAAAGESAELRKFALDALGSIGSAAAVAPARAAVEDPDPNVRLSAIETLGKLATADAVQALQALLAGPSAEARLAALDALGRCGAPVPLELLSVALRERRSRRAAVRALAHCPDDGSAAALVEALLDRVRGVRQAALGGWAVRVREGRAARLPALAAESRAQLSALAREALAGDDLEAANGAADLLGALGEREAAVPLARAAEREELRASLRAALVRLGPSISPEVQRELPLLPAAGRALVFEALAELGSAAAPSAELALRWIGESAEEIVRLSALELLGAVGAEEAVDPLLDLLEAGPPIDRGAEAALAALGRRHPDRLRTLCRSRLRTRVDPPGALLRLLGSVGTAEDLTLLTELFWREHASRPREARVALGALRELGPLDERLLRAAAASPDVELAKEALRAAAAQLRWDVVHQHASHPHWEIRCLVAGALRQQGGPAAIAGVAEMLGRETHALAAEEERAALRALGSPAAS
ncbi:MAG: HEAT repeat domain-containing protein [Myxococcales bacterium]